MTACNNLGRFYEKGITYKLFQVKITMLTNKNHETQKRLCGSYNNTGVALFCLSIKNTNAKY